MSTLFLYALLALTVPYAVFRWYGGLTRTVYQGKALAMTPSLLGRDRLSKTHDIIPVRLPDGTSMILELAISKLAQLRSMALALEPTVTVKQSLFGGRYISDALWPGDKAATSSETETGGLYLSVIYFLLGMVAAGLALEPATYVQFGFFGLAYTALLFVMAGAFLARHMFRGPVAVGQMKLLYFINIGSGKAGLLSASALAVMLAVGSFAWAGTFATAGGALGGAAFVLLLVGMSSAFSLGMLGGLATRGTQAQR